MGEAHFHVRTLQLSFAVVIQAPSKLNNLIWTLTKCLPDLFSFTLPVVSDLSSFELVTAEASHYQ